MSEPLRRRRSRWRRRRRWGLFGRDRKLGEMRSHVSAHGLATFESLVADLADVRLIHDLDLDPKSEVRSGFF